MSEFCKGSYYNIVSPNIAPTSRVTFLREFSSASSGLMLSSTYFIDKAVVSGCYSSPSSSFESDSALLDGSAAESSPPSSSLLLFLSSFFSSFLSSFFSSGFFSSAFGAF